MSFIPFKKENHLYIVSQRLFSSSPKGILERGSIVKKIDEDNFCKEYVKLLDIESNTVVSILNNTYLMKTLYPDCFLYDNINELSKEDLRLYVKHVLSEKLFIKLLIPFIIIVICFILFVSPEIQSIRFSFFGYGVSLCCLILFLFLMFVNRRAINKIKTVATKNNITLEQK